MLYLLWAISGALLVLWLLAVGGALVTSGWIHTLLLAALLALAATVFTTPRRV
jgi:hypothetical protein